MAQISDQDFIRLYKEFKSLNKFGTDAEFAKFLNDRNIQPGVLGKETGLRNKKFNDKAIAGRRFRLNIKTNIKPTESPAFNKEYEKRNKVLTRLVNKANQGDKFISNQQISFMAEKELGIKPRYDASSKGGDRKPFFKSKIATAGKKGFPILNQLDTRVDKIDKVIKNLLVSEEPLTEQLSKVIVDKTGISQANFIKIRDQVPSYKAIKKQAERLPSFLNKANNAYLLELPLAEQLQEVNTLIKGNPAYTYGKGKDVLKTVSTAREDAMKYALRSWNQNKGQGDIKFFDAKGKPIPWQKGIRLKYGKVSFEYNGKKYNTANLTPDVLKKDFKELYDVRTELNKFRGQKIPNPFKKGTEIPVEKLIRKIQVDGYKWSPSFPTLEILHGAEGVKGKPFTDLRYNTKDINVLESGLSKNLASGKINEENFKKAMTKLNEPFVKGDVNQAIIDRVTKQAGKIKEGAFYGYDTLKKNIAKLNEPDLRKVCRALGAFNVGGDVAGCAAAIEANPIKAATAIEEIKPTSAALGKVKNAATAFLKFAGKGKTFAVTAGVGAGAGALVKAFRNDDPTTYLTNDKQANAMILDTADQLEREERMEAVGDAPELLDEANIAANLGVTAAAIPGSKKVFDARKKKGFGAVRAGLGPVGKALSGFATPLGIAATTPLNVASQVYQGDSVEDIVTDPLNYLGPAFAGSLTKEATAGMPKGGMLNKALRLGMSPAGVRGISKFFGLPGLALSLGYEGYDQYKKYTEGRGFVYNLLNKDE